MSALADQTRWMDATDQAALVASGEVSPSELLEAAIERIERIDPALNAVVIRWFDHARENRRKPRSPQRPVPRCAVPHQGPLRRLRRAADQQRQRRAERGALHRRRGHDTRQPLPRGGAGDRRPHEQPGTGQRADHRARRVGRDAQPVGHDAHARRIERRCGRGGGFGNGAVRPRQRRRRIDSYPGVVLRAGRAQAEPGSHHARPDPRRERTRGRALRQPHGPRLGRACSTRRAARASATP